MRECFGIEKHNIHAVYWINELKVEIHTSLNLKFNQKKFDANEVTKILSMF